jgi:G3E family GTPase
MSDDDEAPQLVDDVAAAAIAAAAAASSPSPAPPIAAASASSSVKPVAASNSNSSTGYVPDPNAPPVPLTILTGWLGAGKTTLLTRILAHFSALGQTLAIVQNEASSFGVEAGLRLSNNEADTGPDSVFNDMLEFSNGCVCCAVKSDFVLGVEALLQRKRFDYIVLECSGLADPGPLANMFWVDPELESSVYLDGIVSLVDARNFLSHLRPPAANGASGGGDADTLEAQQVIHQVAYADRVVLNKLDLVSAEEVAECRREIGHINASAPVLTAVRSDVPMERILHIHAFDVNDTSRALTVPPPLEAADGAASGADGAVAPHPHDHSIRTFMVDNVATPPLQRKRVSTEKLKRWLSELLWRDVVEVDQPDAAAAAGDSADASASSSAASPPPAAGGVMSVAQASGKTRPEGPAGPARVDDMRPNSLFRVKAILDMDRPVPTQTAAINAATSSSSSSSSSSGAPAETDPPTFLQAVQELYDLQPGVEWSVDSAAQKAWPGPFASEAERRASQRFSRFVFIGRRLDQQALR